MISVFARTAIQPEVPERKFFLKLTTPRLYHPAVVAPACRSTGKILFASQSKITKRICKRCRKEYVEEENHAKACQYHSLNWSGGEMAKVLQ